MVRPDDYLPPGARRYVPPPPPTLWQRVRDPLLVTATVSAGVTLWVLAVQVGGRHPQSGMAGGALLVIGVISLLRPAWGFEFGSRWTFQQEPKPSDAYLVTTRVAGAVVTVVALAYGAALVSGHGAPPAGGPDGSSVVEQTGDPYGVDVTAVDADPVPEDTP